MRFNGTVVIEHEQPVGRYVETRTLVTTANDRLASGRCPNCDLTLCVNSCSCGFHLTVASHQLPNERAPFNRRWRPAKSSLMMGRFVG